jgi:hypothetical protein
MTPMSSLAALTALAFALTVHAAERKDRSFSHVPC